MPAAATLVLCHGKVITVDRHGTIAEAVAIDGDTILHVGNSAEMQPFISPETRLIELRGACVIPGLIDAHMDREGLRDLATIVGGQMVYEATPMPVR
jgi:predicted amidohydrolase YtcJ